MKSEALAHPTLEVRRDQDQIGSSLSHTIHRDGATDHSDVDLLVAFADQPTFRNFMDLQIFLEILLGCDIDLITETGLRREVRPYVEKDAIRVA